MPPGRRTSRNVSCSRFPHTNLSTIIQTKQLKAMLPVSIQFLDRQRSNATVVPYDRCAVKQPVVFISSARGFPETAMRANLLCSGRMTLGQTGSYRHKRFGV